MKEDSVNDIKQWEIIDEEFISYYGGTAYKISDGGCYFWIWERKEDVQKICDKLNEYVGLVNALREELELADKQNTILGEENEQLKQQNELLENTIESLTAN